MQTIHIRQWFRASPEAVFDRFSKHDQLGDIWPGRFGRMHDGDDGHENGRGSIREIRLPGLKFREQVTEYRPPNLIAYRIVSGAPFISHHYGVMRFRQEGMGTLLDYRIELDAPWPLAAVLARALKGSLKPGIRRLAADWD